MVSFSSGGGHLLSNSVVIVIEILIVIVVNVYEKIFTPQTTKTWSKLPTLVASYQGTVTFKDFMIPKPHQHYFSCSCAPFPIYCSFIAHFSVLFCFMLNTMHVILAFTHAFLSLTLLISTLLKNGQMHYCAWKCCKQPTHYYY